MKNLTIVANFKSNKTLSDCSDYLEKFAKIYKKVEGKEVVICPSFVHLQFFLSFIKDNNLDIKLGAQNVSHFEEGPFTGEVNAKQLRDFVSYCIVGHSERRREFSEEPTIVNDKISHLKKAGITPVVCISDLKELDFGDFSDCIVAYEPPYAIGTGNPEDPKKAEEFGQEIKKRGVRALYGASVDSLNVGSFTRLSSIDGVLVGTDSLDPQRFNELIQNA